jgi:flagellar biosynthesis protein
MSTKKRPQPVELMKEIAVALTFDPAAPTVPTVVASGRGAIAEQILALAFEHGIKVRQDANLVEILAALELGSDIPIAAFAAVAEIMAHVYRAELAQLHPDELHPDELHPDRPNPAPAQAPAPERSAQQP